MKLSRQVGTVSQKLNIFIRDATNTSSAGLANITASSVTYAFCRSDQATASSGTCSTSSGTLGTFNVSSLTQMLSTHMLGWYQFCPPDVAFASGDSVVLHLYGAPNMAPTPIEVELTKSNNQVYLSSAAISTVANVQTLVGVSTLTIPVGVSSFALPVGVSSFALPVGISSNALGVNVSSINGAAVTGNGTAGNLWRG